LNFVRFSTLQPSSASRKFRSGFAPQAEKCDSFYASRRKEEGAAQFPVQGLVDDLQCTNFKEDAGA
jgi:hypothetical protein